MSLTIKNYKKLQNWSHQYKEFVIDEVIEHQTEYCFRVVYNSTPYTITIFRQGTSTIEYEVILKDGMNTTQYGREWIKIHFSCMRPFHKVCRIFPNENSHRRRNSQTSY